MVISETGLFLKVRLPFPFTDSLMILSYMMVVERGFLNGGDDAEQ